MSPLSQDWVRCRLAARLQCKGALTGVSLKNEIPISRKEEMYVDMAGQKKPGFELVLTRDLREIEDGRITVVGPEIDDLAEGSQVPLGVYIEVAGRKMQPDFEPILERQIHDFANRAHGVFHMGQRDINWVRISKEAQRAGFKFAHLGSIIHALYHSEYGAIVDKVQVTLLTDETEVTQRIGTARATYRERDERMAGLTDEAVETFYSCLLCQSFAPNHVCIITPERSGLCGAYNWLDGKAAHQIKPAGPNQPVTKGRVIDPGKGQWAGVNECVFQNSHKTLEVFNAYSIVEYPMTSCGCFECVSCILPTCNGIMTVYREFAGMTPSGMKFSTLAGTVGGGLQTPGFIGHSKHYIGSKKFILAEGGIRRLVWMHKSLKEEMGDVIKARAAEHGLENFLEMVADETVATTEEQVFEYISQVNHPALSLPAMF